MGRLHEVLARSAGERTVPGAVGLIAHGDRVEVDAVGHLDVEGTAAMARDSIFRIASVSKPVTAAAVMLLVDDGVLALDDPVRQWLPELASPQVVRTPQSPVEDVVPAVRAITVADLLTSRAGYGFGPDFSAPAVELLFTVQPGPRPQQLPAPDAWMAALAGVPLLHQPGEAWLYNTCSDLQGVLVARATGRPLPEFLTERLFAPLGMADSGFSVPPAQRHRFTSAYRPSPGGTLELADAPDGAWSSPPEFPSGAGGLVSTADDLLAFARMLLAGGTTVGGGHLLSAESVRQMTTDHLTPAQRSASTLFLEGQGWGFGGSVDVAKVDPWNRQGRYGWVGGTGTAAHLTPSSGAVSILLTQVEMVDPTPPALMGEFWVVAAGA